MSGRNLLGILEGWLSSGVLRIGQIWVERLSEGGFELCHVGDVGRADLESWRDPFAARRLSLTNDLGEYRPLKTAPDLRRGWRLELVDLRELQIALDFFYPAMLGLWADHQRGALRIVPLRETLDRQTGMYAASKRLQEAEGQELVGKACCAEKCLKRTLWSYAEGIPLSSLSGEKVSPRGSIDSKGVGEIPMLCHEACNLLVAAARETVKRRERASAASHGG